MRAADSFGSDPEIMSRCAGLGTALGERVGVMIVIAAGTEPRAHPDPASHPHQPQPVDSEARVDCAGCPEHLERAL